MRGKRMFSNEIVKSDRFLDMSISAQCLYFHLGMVADDDGFVGSPRAVARQVGCNIDDLKNLAEKNFIICFESGVILITDWNLNNYLRPDRYMPTQYTNELSEIYLKDNNTYAKGTIENGIPNGIPVGSPKENKLNKLNKIHGRETRLDVNIDCIREVVDYLNRTVRVHYKPTTKKTQQLINARLDEGYTLEDFKRVIDIKAKQWKKDPEKRKWLRPTTLFGDNFESYLNEDVQEENRKANEQKERAKEYLM